MRRHLLATALTGLTGLAFGVAGCGASTSTGSSNTTTSTPTTSSASTTTISQTGSTGTTGAIGTTGATGATGSATTTTLSSSQAITAARAALLTRADVPASWTSTPATGNSGGLTHAQQVQIAQCLGVPLSEIAYNPPEVDSPEFDGPGGLPSIDDAIQVFPTAAIARQQFNMLLSPRTPQCLTEVFIASESQLKKTLPAGSTISKLTTTTIPFAQLADGSAGLLIRFTVTVQDRNVGFALSLIAVLDGRYGITLEATNETSPMSPSYLHGLAAINVSRLP
jgi:hypothetical protein